MHHIYRWCDYPELRYEVSNGASLCYKHHKEVTGSEEHYISLLNEIIRRRNA